MVGAILVDYKSAHLTGTFIRHAIAKLAEVRRFVVVDNSLDDPNFQLLVQEFEDCAQQTEEPDVSQCALGEPVRRIVHITTEEAQILLVQAGGNIGFARGNNLAMRADKCFFDSSLYLITNNDIQIHQTETISELERVLREHPEVVCAGPRVIGLDGLPQSPHRYVGITKRWIFPMAGWMINSLLWRISPALVERLTSDIMMKKTPGYVYRLIGAFMLADVGRFWKIGLFDAETFIYAEEMILAERARKNGLHMYYLPGITITHEQGVTTRNVFNMERQLKQKFNSERLYYSKYRGTSNWMIQCAERALKFYTKTYIQPRMKRKQGES